MVCNTHYWERHFSFKCLEERWSRSCIHVVPTGHYQHCWNKSSTGHCLSWLIHSFLFPDQQIKLFSHLLQGEGCHPKYANVLRNIYCMSMMCMYLIFCTFLPPSISKPSSPQPLSPYQNHSSQHRPPHKYCSLCRLYEPPSE